MQINRTTDYAIRILTILAQEKRIVSSAEIAKNMKLSQRYIIGIAKKLRENGYVKVGHGIVGGYSLNCPPHEITLLDIIVLMEGKITISRCLTADVHCDGLPCVLHGAYSLLQSLVEDCLQTLTLEMLITKPVNAWSNEVIMILCKRYQQELNFA